MSDSEPSVIPRAEESRTTKRLSLSRLLFAACGVLALVLGIIGIVLPLLPTTPFLLLAAWCFARSSDRLHQWLHNHPSFGVILTNWHEHRGIRAAHKKRAFLFIIASFSLSVAIVPLWPVKVLLVIGCLCLLYFMSRIKTLP